MTKIYRQKMALIRGTTICQFDKNNMVNNILKKIWL